MGLDRADHTRSSPSGTIFLVRHHGRNRKGSIAKKYNQNATAHLLLPGGVFLESWTCLVLRGDLRWLGFCSLCRLSCFSIPSLKRRTAIVSIPAAHCLMARPLPRRSRSLCPRWIGRIFPASLIGVPGASRTGKVSAATPPARSSRGRSSGRSTRMATGFPTGETGSARTGSSSSDAG